MSGMAGNVTAFNTVWTFDIYQSYIRPRQSDAHYLWMGRMATVVRRARQHGDRVRGDALQQHHGHAAAGVLLRERAAVCDLSARHVLEAHDRPWRVLGSRCRDWRRRAALRADHVSAERRRCCRRSPSLHAYPSDMAQNFWGAIVAWTTCFVVTGAISLMTAAKADDDLRGLVFGLTRTFNGSRAGVAPASRRSGRGRSHAHAGAEHSLLVTHASPQAISGPGLLLMMVTVVMVGPATAQWLKVPPPAPTGPEWQTESVGSGGANRGRSTRSFRHLGSYVAEGT